MTHLIQKKLVTSDNKMYAIQTWIERKTKLIQTTSCFIITFMIENMMCKVKKINITVSP